MSDSTVRLSDLAFVIFKPDTVKQNLESGLWSFFRKHDIFLMAQKEGTITKDDRKKLYRDFHLNSRTNWEMGTRFYELGPALFLILYKRMESLSLAEFISKELKGNFVAVLSQPGTIRGEFNAINPVFNLIHSSDSVRDTLREAQIFFARSELKCILQRRLMSEELDLSHKTVTREIPLNFEQLLYEVKLQLVQTSHLDEGQERKIKERLTYYNRELCKITDRHERRQRLLLCLNEEQQLLLLQGSHELLDVMADHERYAELDYDRFFRQLQNSGIYLDRWQSYLLQSSMYYIHF